MTDASPQQPEPDEPAEGGPRAPRDGDEQGRKRPDKTPPRWSDQQPAPAPWYVGRPGPAPQPPPAWGAAPPRHPAPPAAAVPPGEVRGPGPQDRPPEHQAPGSAGPDGGGQVPGQAPAPGAQGAPPPAAPPPYGRPPQPPQGSGQDPYGQPGPYGPQGPYAPPYGRPAGQQGPQPWHDPNRYGQPQRPPQRPNDPWAPQQRRPERPPEPERGPLDLRTRWARGISFGAILCTLAAVAYGTSHFPIWLVGAGTGLVLGLVGLWLGVFSHRAAAARGKRVPQAVTAIVFGSIASLISLLIIAFSLILYGPLSQLSNCERTADTIAQQNQCQTNFENQLGGVRR